MQKIWILQIEFKPAGALTFRKMPSGILHIMSYPFLPPTTMSGFVRRLSDIASGRDWQGYGREWYIGPGGKEFTWTLDERYRALGAFPPSNAWRIHKTRRHGPKNFKHSKFAQILRGNDRENYQLHHWDYLFCEGLTGWIAARNKADLEELMPLKNFGGKAGKEGYLWAAHIEQPKEILMSHGEFKPLGLVTSPDPLSLRSATAFSDPHSVRDEDKQGQYCLINGTVYHIYGHHWNKDYTWANGETGGVDGYFPLTAWWETPILTGDYWELYRGVGFAAHTIDAFFKGEGIHPFYETEANLQITGGIS